MRTIAWGVIVVAAWTKTATADCQIYNDTPIFLAPDGGGSVHRPYFVEDYDATVVLKPSDAWKQAQPAPLKVKCPSGRAIRLDLVDHALVATVLPRSIRIDADWKTGHVEIRGPRGMIVRIAGKDIAVTKGKAVWDPDQREMVLTAEQLAPEQLVYGYTPVSIDATAGKDHVEVAFAAEFILELSKIEDEAFAIDQAPVSWATTTSGAAPHPALFVSQMTRGGSKSLTPANGLHRLADAQIIAVGKLVPSTVETCQYSGTGGAAQIARVRIDLDVTVYEATTGKKLDEKTFTGGDPRACPDRTTMPYDIEGPHPDADAITWLAGY